MAHDRSLIIYAVFFLLCSQNQALIRVSMVCGMQASCTEAYRGVDGHTMCLPPNPGLTRAGVSLEDQQHILDLHNDYRRQVQPPPADMQIMVWDDRLATVAQQWASQCIYKHDVVNRIADYDEEMGQNIVAGLTNWTEVIAYWFAEKNHYVYGVPISDYLGPSGWLYVGHYTQMVENTSSIMGCGFAECENTMHRTYFVCNYLAGQGGRLYAPYTQGEPCSACPTQCTNQLCDCSGLYCFHGGTIELSTCTCVCRSPYTGSDCLTLSCPEGDHSMCSWLWSVEHCEVPRVKLDCPYMCGLCGQENVSVPPISTPAPIFVSNHGCTFVGKRPSERLCGRLGEHGEDSQHCDTNGGVFKCADCSLVNVRMLYCPIMCGLCDVI